MKRPVPPLSYAIRLARTDELKALLDMEHVAGQRFATIPLLAEMPDDITPMEELQEAQRNYRFLIFD